VKQILLQACGGKTKTGYCGIRGDAGRDLVISWARSAYRIQRQTLYSLPSPVRFSSDAGVSWGTVFAVRNQRCGWQLALIEIEDRVPPRFTVRLSLFAPGRRDLDSRGVQ